jgi:hypothetical protein
MSSSRKTLLHRLFGAGRIPGQYAPRLRAEGIVLSDEGIGGSITLKNFRAPGRWHSWKRNWFTGCVVLTKRTFAAFALGKPIIYVPLDHKRLSELHLSVVDRVLFVGFDAAAFNEGWTGMVECRLKTAEAQLFVEGLEAIDSRTLRD